MSQENVVRVSLPIRNRKRRTLDERLALRFPRLFGVLGRRVLRLPSRLRTAALARQAGLGFGAVNRRDFDVALLSYRPDVTITVASELLGTGDLKPTYFGHDGFREIYDAWLPAWGDSFRFQDGELVIAGRELVGLVTVRMRGEGSGVEIARPFAYHWTLDEDARIVHEHQYFEWADALRSIGLSE